MAIHGKGGNLSVGGTNIANIESYTLTRIGETSETSSMGDTWATFLAGLTDFNATAEAKSKIGLDTVALLGSSGTALFSTASGADSYSANAIYSGITETATIEEAITISYTLEGSAAAGLVFNATGGTAATGTDNPIHGKSIDAQFNDGGGATSFTDIQGWTVTMTAPVHDASVASASAFGRQKLPGIYTATATVTTLLPASDLEVLEGETVTLDAWRANGTAATGYYSGSAICTGHELGFSTTAVETVTYSFIYNGELQLIKA